MVRRRGALGAILLGLGGLVAAGCAIPTQQAPSTISASRVPPGLVSPAVPTTTTTQPRLSSEVPVKIFLLGPGGELVPRNRVVLVPAPLTSIITSMLAGPDGAESAAGLTTDIPNDVVVLSAVTQGTVVTVNFNDAFGEITGSATELAVAQVVATVVTQSGLGTGVLFEIDGDAISVPIASGAQVPGPVYLWQIITRAS
jgi:hypothetical protein